MINSIDVEEFNNRIIALEEYINKQLKINAELNTRINVLERESMMRRPIG